MSPEIKYLKDDAVKAGTGNHAAAIITLTSAASAAPRYTLLTARNPPTAVFKFKTQARPDCTRNSPGRSRQADEGGRIGCLTFLIAVWSLACATICATSVL